MLQQVSANGSERVTVILKRLTQRRYEAYHVFRQAEYGGGPAECARIEERHRGQQSNFGDAVKDVLRAVDRPVQRRAGPPHDGLCLLRPDRYPVVEVDLQFAG